MKIDIANLEEKIKSGNLVQADWGRPNEERCCLMSALAGYSKRECTANGWPKWLTELFVLLFDAAPDDKFIEWGRELARAAQYGHSRDADWHEIFKAIRMESILPIAMKAIGEGEEKWRREGRAGIQRAIDENGRAINTEYVLGTSSASLAALGTEEAGAFWAASATDGGPAAKAAAIKEIYESTIKILNQA